MVTRRIAIGVTGVLASVLAAAGPPAGALASEDEPRWQPAPGATWQIQLSGRPDLSVPADIYEFDADSTSRRKVARLHRRGARVVCYLDAGTWEPYRADADRYPSEVLGRRVEGWPDERWVDIRRLDVLRPILRGRLERCARKGFDGVDWDNVNGFANRTGFPLTGADQLRFNRWLARVAHRAGLAVGLKNDLAQARDLEPAFDFAVLEQCVEFRECRLSAPFRDAGKPIVDIEYGGDLARACRRTAALGITLLRKRLPLGPWVRRCPARTEVRRLVARRTEADPATTRGAPWRRRSARRWCGRGRRG